MNTLSRLTNGPRASTRYGLMALVAAICALAIPASASASYGSAPDSAPTPSGGPAPDGVPNNAGLVAPDHSALNGSLAPISGSGPGGIEQPPATTPVSSPHATGDQFDWADAALGAGITMAMVAIGGAALLTLRRRTAVSPSA
jgi:hypothetical protein